MIPFLVGVLLKTFFYTWVYNATSGSVLMAILLHDVFNATLVVIPMPPSDWWYVGMTTAIVTGLVAARPSQWFVQRREPYSSNPAET
jgi:membrane protease YdiL (CAAX protease family)